MKAKIQWVTVQLGRRRRTAATVSPYHSHAGRPRIQIVICVIPALYVKPTVLSYQHITIVNKSCEYSSTIHKNDEHSTASIATIIYKPINTYCVEGGVSISGVKGALP